MLVYFVMGNYPWLSLPEQTGVAVVVALPVAVVAEEGVVDEGAALMEVADSLVVVEVAEDGMGAALRDSLAAVVEAVGEVAAEQEDRLVGKEGVVAVFWQVVAGSLAAGKEVVVGVMEAALRDSLAAAVEAEDEVAEEREDIQVGKEGVVEVVWQVVEGKWVVVVVVGDAGAASMEAEDRWVAEVGVAEEWAGLGAVYWEAAVVVAADGREVGKQAGGVGAASPVA